MARAIETARLAEQLAGRLHVPLVALHAATEVASLWRAVRALLRTALKPHRVTLFLGHLGMGEARLVYTDPPIAHPVEWYTARGRLNPFSPYIEANRGVKFYRFRDVLPPREEFTRSEFYRRFARREGWDKGVSALYWRRREVTAMFSVYRAPAQPEFTDGEMALLRYLHPFVGTAIARVQRLHTERLARRSLEEFNRNIPVGLVVLDWDLRVQFDNPEAHRQCAVWNLGPDAVRIYNPRDAFALPEPILAACRRLREQVLARNPKLPLPRAGDVAQVAHRPANGLRAQVTVVNNPGSLLARPRFLVVLDARSVASVRSEATLAERMKLLRDLTPREREIALLVCEGQSNAEIAGTLCKSVLTIKTQLNAVFRKLGVKSRARLMVLLR